MRKIELSKLPRILILAFAATILIVLGVLDYTTGPDLSFSIFYLLPVSLVAWFFGTTAGTITALFSAAISLEADLYFSRQSGSYNPLVPYWNAFTRLGILLVVNFILSSLKNALQHERELARTDPVTGIANARSFYELISIELERAQRYKYPLTIVYADIDDFKIINDRYGHRTGDKILCIVAEAIRNNIRSSDILARIGGDEFIMVLPETGYTIAQSAILRVQNNIIDVTQKSGWPITLSIGLVTFITPHQTIEEMIGIADELMYLAKSSGKNNVKHKLLDSSAMETEAHPIKPKV